MSARQAVQKLNREQEVEVTVISGSSQITAIRGKTIPYMDMEEYNQWARTNRSCGIVAATLILCLLGWIYSIDIFIYLKLEGMKYYKPK